MPLVEYKTGVYAPDGYAETSSAYICDWEDCRNEADYQGLCEKHFCIRDDAEAEELLNEMAEAEGEKPPKMLYVAFDCLGNPYAVSTRPEHIACDPARIKPYVPVEAEGEEPDGK